MSLRSLLDALTSGIKAAFIITACGGAGLLAYSFLVDRQVVYLPYAVMILAVVSVLLGGMQGGLVSGGVGWAHGSMVSAFYLLMLLAVKGLISSSFDYNPGRVMFALAVLICGAVGGVIGVNLRFSRSRRVKRRYMSY